MNDTLETLLIQLRAMKDAAEAMVASEYQEGAPLDFDGENRIWFAMEENRFDGWTCGWLMKPDEATEFVIEESGRTPIEAALALRRKMIEGT